MLGERSCSFRGTPVFVSSGQILLAAKFDKSHLQNCGSALTALCTQGQPTKVHESTIARSTSNAAGRFGSVNFATSRRSTLGNIAGEGGRDVKLSLGRR